MHCVRFVNKWMTVCSGRLDVHWGSAEDGMPIWTRNGTTGHRWQRAQVPIYRPTVKYAVSSLIPIYRPTVKYTVSPLIPSTGPPSNTRLASICSLVCKSLVRSFRSLTRPLGRLRVNLVID